MSGREGPSRWDLAALGGLRLGVSGALLASGFYAISDDDFSRVVIAQRFAGEPRLDPSGTSWLPLPFWLTGAAMMGAGRSLPVARGAALVAAVAAILLVHRAALWLGATRRTALASAAVTALLPTAARLGASFQPELLTAALVVLGAAATSPGGTGSRRQQLGALALAAACLCRYEAWPAALVFAGLTLRDATLATRASIASRFGPALLALAAPALWMVHGAVNREGPLFFLTRVASYRRALGESEPLGQALTAYPRALLAEPELMLGALAAIAGAWYALALRRRRQPGTIDASRVAAWTRFSLVLGSVLLFLAAGRVLDGAPTHHPERTLLPIWFGLAMAGVDAASRLPRLALFLALAATTALGLGLRFQQAKEAAVTRADERAIGEHARREVPEGARLAVDTTDLGYFAVMAAFQDPGRAIPVQARDPRLPAPADPFGSASALAARLRELEATWFVAERGHWAVALRVGKPVTVRGPFALLRVLP